MDLVLRGTSLTKEYLRENFLGNKIEKIQALKGVDFDVISGEMLGIVGESGSGKSTLARIICGIDSESSGQIIWIKGASAKVKANHAQMVFQNPFNSLNPKLKIGYMIKEAISYGSGEPIKAIDDMKAVSVLATVGMNNINLSSYPHQFSGGQRQRLGIARALALNPSVLVCDEPVSALDISIQAQIINLLLEINSKTNISIIFISHDIEVVATIADRLIVMKDGMIVESGDTSRIMKEPESDYTKLLLSAVPKNPWLATSE